MFFTSHGARVKVLPFCCTLRGPILYRWMRRKFRVSLLSGVVLILRHMLLLRRLRTPVLLAS